MNRRSFLFAMPVLTAIAAVVGPPIEFLAKVPPCDVCGVLADPLNWRTWTLARDAYEIEPSFGGHEAFNLGPCKSGCGAHPAKSITYNRRTCYLDKVKGGN